MMTIDVDCDQTSVISFLIPTKKQHKMPAVRYWT